MSVFFYVSSKMKTRGGVKWKALASLFGISSAVASNHHVPQKRLTISSMQSPPEPEMSLRETKANLLSKISAKPFKTEALTKRYSTGEYGELAHTDTSFFGHLESLEDLRTKLNKIEYTEEDNVFTFKKGDHVYAVIEVENLSLRGTKRKQIQFRLELIDPESSTAKNLFYVLFAAGALYLNSVVQQKLRNHRRPDGGRRTRRR